MEIMGEGPFLARKRTRNELICICPTFFCPKTSTNSPSDFKGKCIVMISSPYCLWYWSNKAHKTNTRHLRFTFVFNWTELPWKKLIWRLNFHFSLPEIKFTNLWFFLAWNHQHDISTKMYHHLVVKSYVKTHCCSLRTSTPASAFFKV